MSATIELYCIERQRMRGERKRRVPHEFHALVYHVVRQVPHGKVTTYGTHIQKRGGTPYDLLTVCSDVIGHIAKLIGMPQHARHVGQALKFLSGDTDVPWQRVVSSTGHISPRGPGTNGAQRQRDALEAEGVDVHEIRGGGLGVTWSECGWFPVSVDLDHGGVEGGGEETGDA